MDQAVFEFIVQMLLVNMAGLSMGITVIQHILEASIAEEALLLMVKFGLRKTQMEAQENILYLLMAVML